MSSQRSSRSVFIGNIPYDATEEQLIQICEEVGPVVSFRLVVDRETGKAKGFGFCEFRDEETAQSARRNLNGQEINGRQLRVDYAESEKNKDREAASSAPGTQGRASPAPVASLGQGGSTVPLASGPPVGLAAAAAAAVAMSASLKGAGPQMNGHGAEEAAAAGGDALTNTLAGMNKAQLYEIMVQMKNLIQRNPQQARQILMSNPQLTKALFQAQIMLGMVKPAPAQAPLTQPVMAPQPPLATSQAVPPQPPHTLAQPAPMHPQGSFTPQPPMPPVQPPRQGSGPTPPPFMQQGDAQGLARPAQQFQPLPPQGHPGSLGGYPRPPGQPGQPPQYSISGGSVPAADGLGSLYGHMGRAASPMPMQPGPPPQPGTSMPGGGSSYQHSMLGGLPQPQPPHLSRGYPGQVGGMHMGGGPQPVPPQGYPPQPSAQPQQGQVAVSSQQQAPQVSLSSLPEAMGSLLQRVLAMTPAQIEALPEEQRVQVNLLLQHVPKAT